MRRILVSVFTAATVLLSACGSDSTTAPTPTSIAGTWNLTTVNGAALPFVLQASPKIEILSDQIVILANGTFTQSTQARLTNGTTITTQTIPDGGTYSLNGTAATFTFTDGGSETATVSGNSMTIAETGLSLVYNKQ
jgi:Lipocalin-like domain